MACFDVYRNQGGSGYLLDVQSDLLSGLNTRMIVPLLPAGTSLQPAQRLNPLFEVESNRVMMATQFMAAVPNAELGMAIASLKQQQFEITGALDIGVRLLIRSIGMFRMSQWRGHEESEIYGRTNCADRARVAGAWGA